MFKKIACAVSGGVDSAVSLYLLKKRGFDVVGVYMQNWDNVEEQGYCSSAKDESDARKICLHVGVPFTTVNFVKDYWNDVFIYFLKSLERGLTPNPDVMCNKYIKFDAFFNYAVEKLRADAIATGHYAANSFGDYLDDFNDNLNAKLLLPADRVKDQTLFLSQISQTALRRTMFPLGKFLKPQVKQMASETGLDKILRNKRESVGICMIGKRKFRYFVDEYLQPRNGKIFDLESGSLVGSHTGIHHYIVGQRMRGVSGPVCYHVAKKFTDSNEIYVCYGSYHEAIFITDVRTSAPHWLRDRKLMTDKPSFRCQFRYEHPQPFLFWCTVNQFKNGTLAIQLDKPVRAVNLGQYAVLYLHDECLGSAEILELGPSLYDQRMSKNYECKLVSLSK